MKYLYVFLLSFCSCGASAQIVNIPDPVLKQYLLNYPFVIVIDTNDDGEIEVTEAEAISSLIIGQGYADSIHDLTGIKAFSNLVSLDVSFTLVTSCNLSEMIHLSSFSANKNKFLTSINVDGCTSLDNFKTLSCPSQDVSFVTNRNLHRLELEFPDYPVTITNLDLSSCDSLNYLNVDGVFAIQTLNVSNLTKLSTVLFSMSSVDNIVATNCSGLISLTTYSTLSNLQLGGCINIQSIHLNGSTSFTSLDLSNCVSLTDLEILGAPQLQYLNIKNGSALTTLSIMYPVLLSICADDFEIADVSNILVANGFTNFTISSFCSFFPAGTYNTIKGTVKLDLTNNGCDPSDAGMPGVAIKITDTSGFNITRYTAASGDYAHYPYKGLFTLTPYFPYSYFNISPTSSTVAFDTANSLMDSANFCITPNGMHNDLGITLLPLTPARPGFQATYKLIYKNRGTTVQSGSIQLNYDNSKMNFSNASINVNSQTSGQLLWNYNNLAPFESRSITIVFDEFAPPINNVGDTLIYLAAVSPVAADETPQDNSFILPQRIVGSYDPNDKQCLDGSTVGYDDLNKSLHYMIRFQNTGTDTAFNVVVTDSLSDKFDWNSVEIISSSHACDIRQTNGKLEFYVQNIKLPWSAINESGSHGYVAFSIKPKPTTTIGDSLNNRAAIYFDFNLPIITNTTTTIVSPVAPLPVRLEYFSVTGKDAANLLTWKAPSTSAYTNFSIERSADGIYFTNIGTITATAERSQLPLYFTDATPLSGKNYYRLKITDADGVSFYSKILSIGNNSSGLEIIAVANEGSNSILYINSLKAQTLQIKIIAADEKLVYHKSKFISEGRSQENLQMKNMPPGLYTLVIQTAEGDVVIKRFVRL